MLLENKFPKTSERRRYERYMAMIQSKVDEKSPIDIYIEGVPVNLVDFALGGMYVLSNVSFSLGETVTLLVDLSEKGKISLLGTVVRISPEPVTESWGIAVDLSQYYGIKVNRKS